MMTPDSSWPRGVPRRLEVPERSVAQNLILTAERQPDGIATIYYGAQLSWAELSDRVDRLAGWLVEVAGVKAGDRVLIFQQNSPLYVLCYYAILRADAAVVPVNPMNKTVELDHILRDTGARTALVGQELLAEITPLVEQGLLDHVVVAACADAADPANAQELPAPLNAPGRADYGLPGVVPLAAALEAGCAPAPP